MSNLILNLLSDGFGVAIIDYATNKDVDLIVIGTRGRAGLKRFLMGSVANAILQHAHCSVLLVR